MIKLIYEMRRRKVFKTVGSYAVVAWLVIQIIVAVQNPLGLPDWSATVVIVALVIGFPACAALAWFYDFSAQGIQRSPKEPVPNVERELRPADRWTIALSVAAAVALLATSAYLVISNWWNQAQTLAVLPFGVAGEETNAQYLGDGVRDSLITRLSRLRNLRIKSANVPSLANDLHRLGAILEVDAFCRGRIEKRGNALELIVELIEPDGSILWREQYSSQSASLLEIEGQVAEKVARQMGFDLSEDDQEELTRSSTANPAAHRLYLQGRYFWNRRTVEGFEASIGYYKEALDLDPNYALAHAGLANTYLMILGWGIKEPHEVAPLIVESAQTAIGLDPSLAEPYAALGYYKTLYERDWEGARDDFLRAIELNNNYSSAHHWYAFLLMTEGNMRAALEEMRLARELEPLSPIINAEVGYFYLFDRRYKKALDALLKAQRLDPNYISTLSYLARAQALLGLQEEALESIERFQVVAKGDPLPRAYFSAVLPLVGLKDDTQRLYQELSALSEEKYVPPGLLGVLAVAIGDYDNAIQHFDAALENRSLVLSWLRDPLLSGFHADPRYAEMMRANGLKP